MFVFVFVGVDLVVKPVPHVSHPQERLADVQLLVVVFTRGGRGGRGGGTGGRGIGSRTVYNALAINATRRRVP